MNEPRKKPSRRNLKIRRYAYAAWIADDVIAWIRSHDRPGQVIEEAIRKSKSYREWKRNKEASE